MKKSFMEKAIVCSGEPSFNDVLNEAILNAVKDGESVSFQPYGEGKLRISLTRIKGRYTEMVTSGVENLDVDLEKMLETARKKFK